MALLARRRHRFDGNNHITFIDNLQVLCLKYIGRDQVAAVPGREPVAKLNYANWHWVFELP